VITISFIFQTSHLLAQGTAFMYQGQLQNNGSPANGSFDMVFSLYATNLAGAAVAGPVTNYDITATNGLFVATIDFGPGVFTGNSYWLDISVSPAGSNTFTELTPRQPVLPAPYAIMATSASNLLGCLPASQLPSIAVTNAEMGVTLTGAFSGSGSGLTGLNPANLSAGTAAINISGNAATATTATSATAATTAATATGVCGGALTTVTNIANGQIASQPLNATNVFGTLTNDTLGNAATATSAATAVTATTALLASNVVSGISITNAYITNSIFAGTHSGNGAGLTNIPSSAVGIRIITTNFQSGAVYSNGYGAPIQVSANAALSIAAVNGAASLSLWVPGSATNICAMETSTEFPPIGITNSIAGFVPSGSKYTFTNSSIGTGNSSTVLGGQILVY
jgi:hypothetical protein